MELNTPDRQMPVLQPHDLLFIGLRRDDKAIRHTLSLDDKRVVPSGFEGARDSLEQPVAVMNYLRGLAMHQPRSSHDATAEHVSDTLMAEAYTEDRYRLAQLPYNGVGNTCKSSVVSPMY
jgi:hypothetical protein